MEWADGQSGKCILTDSPVLTNGCKGSPGEAAACWEGPACSTAVAIVHTVRLSPGTGSTTLNTLKKRGIRRVYGLIF